MAERVTRVDELRNLVGLDPDARPVVHIDFLWEAYKAGYADASHEPPDEPTVRDDFELWCEVQFHD